MTSAPLDTRSAPKTPKSVLERLTPLRGEITSVNSGYSRFVSMMKIGLPLVALLLVVLILIWPRLQSGDNSFQLTFANISDDESGTTGMTKARFVGTDAERRPYVITAETASQSNASADVITLNSLQADMTLRSGTWVTMAADKGIYYRSENRLELMGPVDIFSDLGYEFHTGDTIFDLSASVAFSDQGVRGQGPFGVLAAKSLRISDKGQKMNFEGDVKLTIEPANK